MGNDDIENRFQHHEPHEETAQLHQDTRTSCLHLAQKFDYNLPESREKSLALTKLEEAMFWANAAIARN